MSGLVTYDLCKGNPGALQFMMLAYRGNLMFLAERGFARMRDNDIAGDKLYMLWNDCCDRNTEQALRIMCENPIEDIIEHINYERGRGIPYKAGDTDGNS